MSTTAPTHYARLTRDQLAARIAQDIPEGAYVNLGIGMPTLVANHLPTHREIVLQSENGILGMGPAPTPGQEDLDLINAGKSPVTLLAGGSYFDSAESFAMMRGGHLDISVLGAFQVAANGDLANWHTGRAGDIPAVGGAMDLAVGAKQTWVMMEHFAHQGVSKIVQSCSYPLTGVRCVTRVYTDIGVIDITPEGFKLVEAVEGLTLDELERISGVPIESA
jgi:3-oxoadipate CoA-transferase, beta subunit